MSSQLHTDFKIITVHTAKCDMCEKRNKSIMYRCTTCVLQVCSLCSIKSPGDGLHVFGNGVGAAPEVNADHVAEDDETNGEKDEEDRGRTRARRRRLYVISDDEDDDDVPVSTPAPSTEKAGDSQATGASEQDGRETNVGVKNGPPRRS